MRVCLTGLLLIPLCACAELCSFTYDVNGRLTAVRTDLGQDALLYEYDAAGNICRRKGLSDSDGDQMDDAWEWNWFGSLTNADYSTDTDGDGMRDWQEFAAYTSPVDADSFLSVMPGEQHKDNVFILRWPVEAHVRYYLITTTNLHSSIWLPVSANISSEVSGYHTLTVTSAQEYACFRVGVQRGDGLLLLPEQQTEFEVFTSNQLAVAGGNGGYQWELSEPQIGQLNVQGDAAVYYGTDEGMQRITVSAGDAICSRVFVQRYEPLRIVEGGKLLTSTGETVRITAQGGLKENCVWQLADYGLGTLNSGGGRSVDYSVEAIGVQTVSVQCATARIEAAVDSRFHLIPAENTEVLCIRATQQPLIAKGGAGHYCWALSDPGIGELSATQGVKIAYTVFVIEGTNRITCTDGTGSMRFVDLVHDTNIPPVCTIEECPDLYPLPGGAR